MPTSVQSVTSMQPATPMQSTATKKVVWLASYPKSGNTWVRFLVCNLLFGRQDSAAALNELAPDVHEMETLPLEPPALLKTHHAFSPRLPYANETRAAVYIVRDPADVLASNFFYAMRRGGAAADSPGAFDRYVDQFIANRGDSLWIERGMGSWEDNVRSWLHGTHSFPVLRVRYEDLSADPERVCGAIAQLLRPESTEAEIERVVFDSSFERLREIERSDIRKRRVGIFYKPYLQTSIDSGLRFMRRGVVGDGAARLTPEQRARLRGAFEPLLVELGY
jgi:hypothetical protein